MQRTCVVRRVARHLQARNNNQCPAFPPCVSSPTKLGLQFWTWENMNIKQGDTLRGGRFLCSLIHERKKSSKQEEALQATLEEISKNFGVEAVMWLGRAKKKESIPVIPTGSISLDIALGIGGLPKGRIVEIYGPEASGKTTLALHVIAEAQKTGGECAFIDAEHTLDIALANAAGIKKTRLLIEQPSTGEQALNYVDQFIRSGTVDVLVVDSVAALIPQAEVIGDTRIALQARLMSQTLRKLIHSISTSKALLIFISQTRSKHSALGYEGPAEANSGSNALKCYSSVRLNVNKSGLLSKGQEIIGCNTFVKVVKNKLAPPFKTAEFEIEFGKGISREGEILDQALKYGVVAKVGSFHSYNGEIIGDSRENAKDHLRGHAELQEVLLMDIRERLVGEGKEHSLPGPTV